MAAMDMVIESLNVSGDKAEASATFRIKQGGGNMAMLYSLERRGSGWAVVNSRPSDGQFVHPPVDGSQSAAPPNTASPAIPDVQEFLKNHPSHQR